MKQYPVLITARTNSSRLPKKCLLPFGDRNVISYIITIAKQNNLFPILSTTKKRSDDILCKIAKSHKINFFRGSEKNKLKRWLDTANKYNLKYFHTLDADDPFFCTKQIKKSINLLIKNKLDIVYPSLISSKGEASEGYSINVKFLEKKLSKMNNSNKDTEMITKYIKGGKSAILSNSEFITKSRLTLDYYEDYIFLMTIKLILKQKITREKIHNLVLRNPDLKKINFFKNIEWKNRQKKLSK